MKCIQQELVKRAVANVGSVAARRYGDKITTYFNDCEREGIHFFLVVVEAVGGWHKDAAALITKLASQLASHTGKKLGVNNM